LRRVAPKPVAQPEVHFRQENLHGVLQRLGGNVGLAAFHRAFAEVFYVHRAVGYDPGYEIIGIFGKRVVVQPGFDFV
jgi:hypothetical protein